MSKTEKFLGLGVLIAIVIAVSAYAHVGGMKAGAVLPSDSSATNYTEVTASNGIAVGTAQQFQVDSTGNIAMANSSGTTTLATVGCVQVYPTSTATKGTIRFNTQATTSLAGTAAGAVVWTYGTCP